MIKKTPQKRRPNQGRRQILASARELILEVGVEKLSLRKVAAHAGYSPASLYEYFNSKEDLLGELSNEVLLRLNARMAKIPVRLSAPQRLVRYGVCYVAFARENPEDYLLVFSKLRSHRNSAIHTPSAKSPYMLLLETAQIGLEDASFSTERLTEDIAYGLWALAHGLAMLQLTHLKGYDVDFEISDRLALEAYVAGIVSDRRSEDTLNSLPNIVRVSTGEAREHGRNSHQDSLRRHTDD